MKSKIGLVLDADFKPFNPIDRSVYGHVLTNYGSQWNLNGRSFDGVDDYVDCGNEASLNINGSYTVSIQIYNNVFNAGREVVTKIGGGKYNYYIYQASDGLTFEAYDGVNDPVKTVSGLNSNAWYDVVMVRNAGDKFYIYIDGNLNTSFTDTLTGSIIASGTLKIAGAVPANFTIDEVRIWNRALFAFEIQQLYLEGKKKGRV